MVFQNDWMQVTSVVLGLSLGQGSWAVTREMVDKRKMRIMFEMETIMMMRQAGGWYGKRDEDVGQFLVLLHGRCHVGSNLTEKQMQKPRKAANGNSKSINSKGKRVRPPTACFHQIPYAPTEHGRPFFENFWQRVSPAFLATSSTTPSHLSLSFLSAVTCHYVA